MKKLASMALDVIDHVTDENIEKLANMVQNLSGAAQSAYIPTIEELEEYKDKDFALIIEDKDFGKLRKFAKFTPELTELNMAFLVDSLDKLPKEVIKIAATNLAAAANKFNLAIPDELEPFKSKRFIKNSIDTSAIKEAHFQHKNTEFMYYGIPSKKIFPIETEIQITKAASNFEKNANNLTINDKFEFIENIQKRAAEYNISFKKTLLEKYAELDVTKFNEDFYDHIQIRKSYLKEDETELKSEYDDLLNRADDLGPLNTAYALEELDKIANLNSSYGKGILEPLVSVVGFNKIAGKEIDGNFITLDKLRKIDKGVLTEIVGNDYIKDLTGEDGIDVYASLPKPLRQELSEYL